MSNIFGFPWGSKMQTCTCTSSTVPIKSKIGCKKNQVSLDWISMYVAALEISLVISFNDDITFNEYVLTDLCAQLRRSPCRIAGLHIQVRRLGGWLLSSRLSRCDRGWFRPWGSWSFNQDSRLGCSCMIFTTFHVVWWWNKDGIDVFENMKLL